MTLRFPPEKIKELEDEFDQVRPRFTNRKGKLRTQWTTKSIGEMAEEIGRTDQYELVYGLACSIHHANFEGLVGYVEINGDEPTMEGPPSMSWVGSALIAAHTYILFTLDTLNKCCELGLDARITESGEEFEKVWKG